jgi:hypothetical protein
VRLRNPDPEASSMSKKNLLPLSLSTLGLVLSTGALAAPPSIQEGHLRDATSGQVERPSQNWVALNMALSTVGLLRMPLRFSTPSETGRPSTKPFSRS